MADLVSLLMQLESLPDAAKALAVGVALTIAGFGLWGTGKNAVRGAVGAVRLGLRGGEAALAWLRKESAASIARRETAERDRALFSTIRTVQAQMAAMTAELGIGKGSENTPQPPDPTGLSRTVRTNPAGQTVVQADGVTHALLG